MVYCVRPIMCVVRFDGRYTCCGCETCKGDLSLIIAYECSGICCFDVLLLCKWHIVEDKAKTKFHVSVQV